MTNKESKAQNESSDKESNSESKLDIPHKILKMTKIVVVILQELGKMLGR
jgi:lipid-binding SYLF domain-containing protein